MPIQRGVGITGLSAILLLIPTLTRHAGAQTVKASPGAVEVPSAHGRTWLLVPNPLFTLRMDRNGQITGSAAPISVAHEESSPACAAVTAVSVIASNGVGGGMATFVPSPRCSFDASAATIVLPMDSAARYAGICNQPWKTVPPPYVCTVDATGKPNCVYTGVSQPLPLFGDAWRRAEGWTGTVPFNGVVQVAIAYSRVPPEVVKSVINPGVQVTCDAIPCVTFAKTLPDAMVGKPYRAQLFSGAHAPVTIRGATPPAGLTVGADGYLSGTPTTFGSADMTIGFDESYACPWNWHTMSTRGGNSQWTHTYRLTVRDGTPPVVSSVTLSADTVPAGGGNVVVTAQATDDVGVVKMMSSRLRPDGTSNTMEMAKASSSGTGGTWTITWPIAANTSATPGNNTIKVWALDLTGNSGYAQPRTVVVLGGAAQGPMQLQIKKP